MDQLKNNQNGQGEEELVDYVKVIIRRKKIIVGIFFVVIIITIVISLLLPKIYKIDTSIEIGKLLNNDKENIKQELAIEDPVQVKGKIDNDVFGVLIRDKLKISEEDFPKIQTSNPKNTNLIIIETESDKVDRAKDVLGNLEDLIITDHQEKIKSQKDLTEKNIKTTEEKIKLSLSDIENTKNKIIPLDNDIERLVNKIKNLEEEKDNLEAKVGALQKVLPYQQDPGTQFALFDAKEKLAGKKNEIEGLYMEINSLKSQKEDLNVQISKLQTDIENYNSEINSLKADLDSIKYTRVIKKPTVSEKKISPSLTLNIAIASILGLFMGIFLAFGKEWWINNKKNIQEGNSKTVL